MCFFKDVMEESLVLIDGECVLCNRVAQFVIRRDPAALIRFAALQSERAMQELGARGLPPSPPGTFVLISRGGAYYRSDAALRLLGLLPRPWSFARALLVIPRPARDLVYRLVARLRYRLCGRTEMCGLLTAAERERFSLPGPSRAKT